MCLPPTSSSFTCWSATAALCTLMDNHQIHFLPTKPEFVAWLQSDFEKLNFQNGKLLQPQGWKMKKNILNPRLGVFLHPSSFQLFEYQSYLLAATWLNLVSLGAQLSFTLMVNRSKRLNNSNADFYKKNQGFCWILPYHEYTCTSLLEHHGFSPGF